VKQKAALYVLALELGDAGFEPAQALVDGRQLLVDANFHGPGPVIKGCEELCFGILNALQKACFLLVDSSFQ